MDAARFVAASSAFDAPAMPAGTRVRYYAPSAELAPFITAYHAYGVAGRAQRVDPLPPMMMLLAVLIDAGPVTVRIRNHVEPVPDVALFGPMTRPLIATTHGGIQIGVGISPLGWARLSRRSAQDLHNRVVPLAGLLGPGWGERLRSDLAAADADDRFPLILDRHLAPLLRTPHPQEQLIARLSAVVADDTTPEIGAVADRLGVTTAVLRRLARQFFGMSPKQLLLRTRFMRSFLRQSGLDGGPPGRSIDPDYYDESHYLRDAQTFLGTTPRRFLDQPADFLRGSIISRSRVLGVPAQVLHHVDPAPGMQPVAQ